MSMKATKDNKGQKRALYRALASLHDEREAKLFLEDLCTPAELEAMADRWAVIEPLKEGIPYRKIHEITGVSVTTITRVARTLKLGDGGYDLVFARVKEL